MAVSAPLTKGRRKVAWFSPVLANIYLHYVLDWWFEGVYAKEGRAKAYIVRYADDFLCCFQDEADARRFLPDLLARLAKFGLEAEPSKTALIRFGRLAERSSAQDDRSRPATFTFLGITHYVGRSRKGSFVVGRKTDGKRMSKKLKEFGDRIRALRTEGGKAMVTYTRQHLLGHINYFGVSGNSRSIHAYVHHTASLLFKWLNRRSQRRSLTWERFAQLRAEGLLPNPRIVHNLYPCFR